MTELFLILDVDGVLNSFKPTSNSFRTMGYPDGYPEGFPLNLDRRHAQWVTSVAEETGATLIWGTTWQKDANKQIGAQIGLPEIYAPPFDTPRMHDTTAPWKSRNILKYVGDNPGVWLDDDPYLKFCLSGSNLIHVLVDENDGLTEEIVEQARMHLLKMRSLMAD